MRAVSRFEANLLRVLQALLHQTPVERVLSILRKPLPRPRCLSRVAVELVQDTLAKGCVQLLARRGWMRERFLHVGKIAEGRLWERITPAELGLTFSSDALEFLVQLVAGTLGTTAPKMDELTVGDRLLFVLSFDALRHTEWADVLRKNWPPLHQDGLCRLAFPDELTEEARIDWHPWITGSGTAILETMQGWFAERWTALERKKETISTAARMRKIGATQERVYGEYLDAIEDAQRWDLARCFLEAARRLLKDQPGARNWIRNLDVSKERLAERHPIYHDAFAFLRQLARFRRWQQQAVSVGYFDDGYQASQLWKADWERFHGEALCERASASVREVELLRNREIP